MASWGERFTRISAEILDVKQVVVVVQIEVIVSNFDEICCFCAFKNPKYLDPSLLEREVGRFLVKCIHFNNFNLLGNSRSVDVSVLHLLHTRVIIRTVPVCSV